MPQKIRTYGYLKSKLSGGNLYISPTREGRREAAEMVAHIRRGGILMNLSDLLEPALGNGWDWVPPEDIVALTDAPIISEDGFINDSGDWEPHPAVRNPRVYAHMNYQIEDPIETWAKGGSVRFDGYELERRTPQRRRRSR